MKQIRITFFAILSTFCSFAQVGIGTTSPNTTLDVRGSLAANSRSFSTTSESVQNTDFALLFTGNSACVLTLPDAATCIGRIIHIKNTKTGTVPILTIATTASQTIDGQSTWLLDDPNESVNVVSDGSNWAVVGQGVPVNTTSWNQDGNNVSSEKSIGTKSGYDLPFITNGAEKMRISVDGSVGIGSSDFDPRYPERLLVDAGQPDTAGKYQNVIIAYGNTNNYAQFNIQNLSAGGKASADICATADNGTEDSNYVDLGINSSTYNNGSANLLNGKNNAYLYSRGQDFVIGNASTSKSMIFFTGGDAPGNEKFRINSNGFIMTAGVASNILPSTDNNYSLGNGSKRWGVVYAANGTIQTSDRRLKTNIHPLQYGLKEVMKMQPVGYNWKDNQNSAHKIGLIAQEIRSLVPEVVVGDEAKENLGMNYAELVPVLINAIKEQQRQIDELKKKVKALERK